jgi:dTDP-4-dehydrorhamnose reductase
VKPVAIVTGAGGLIGSYLVKTSARWAPTWRVVGLTRQDVDLTDSSRVRELWSTLEPGVVIHCAALSRSVACERDPAFARKQNVEVTALLAELSSEASFLFLSSEHVFDGRKSWYVETDEINPLNVYGATKAEAEQLVLRNPRHSVVRLVLSAGTSPTGDRSFVEDMRRSCRAGQRLTLFTDEFRCPLAAGVTARALWELIDHERPGLYHLGGRDRLSRWEIGQALIPWYGEFASHLYAGSVSDYGGPLRPADLSLRCDKIQKLLSFRLPGFREWLARSQASPDIWDYVAP